MSTLAASREREVADVEAFNREDHTLVRAYLESRRKEMSKIDGGRPSSA
jgi:hypothetical protein